MISIKNVRPYQLCKVIVKRYDEYVNDARHACSDLTGDVHLDGSVGGVIPSESLAAYYGVKKVVDDLEGPNK